MPSIGSHQVVSFHRSKLTSVRHGMTEHASQVITGEEAYMMPDKSTGRDTDPAGRLVFGADCRDLYGERPTQAKVTYGSSRGCILCPWLCPHSLRHRLCS